MNLDTLQFSSAVVHDVPRGGNDGEPLVLTNAVLALDDALRSYFRRKIIQSLGQYGLDVIVDPDGPTASATRSQPSLTTRTT